MIRVIIDSSRTNMVTQGVAKDLQLATVILAQPYRLSLLKYGNEIIVHEQCLVPYDREVCLMRCNFSNELLSHPIRETMAN